jgi:energy-converting hydrogenase B subunit D
VIPLQAVALALVALAGLAVVVARDIVRQALVNGFFGLSLVVLFLVFQAPDVALSAITVGSAAAPLVLTFAIVAVRRREGGR